MVDLFLFISLLLFKSFLFFILTLLSLFFSFSYFELSKERIRRCHRSVSQISYSLVVILELSGVLEVQYKKIMMSSINKNN